MGTSLIRNRAPLEPYSKTMQEPYGGPEGGGLFRLSEVTLQKTPKTTFWDVCERVITPPPLRLESHAPFGKGPPRFLALHVSLQWR